MKREFEEEQTLYYRHEAYRLKNVGAVIYLLEYMKDPEGEKYERTMGHTLLCRIGTQTPDDHPILMPPTAIDFMVEPGLLDLYTATANPIAKRKVKTLEEIPSTGLQTLFDVIDWEFQEDDILDYQLEPAEDVTEQARQVLETLSNETGDALHLHNGSALPEEFS